MLANQGLILCMSSDEIPDFPEFLKACVTIMAEGEPLDKYRPATVHAHRVEIPEHEAEDHHTSSQDWPFQIHSSLTCLGGGPTHRTL